MGGERTLSVMIVDQGLDHKGVLTNAAFVLGLSVGRILPGETFGPDVTDGDGSVHRSLTNLAHFVRKAGQSKLRSLRSEFAGIPQVSIVDYTEEAAPSDYQEYAANLRQRKGEEISYRAIHLFGPESLIAPKTKNLSRLE